MSYILPSLASPNGNPWHGVTAGVQPPRAERGDSHETDEVCRGEPPPVPRGVIRRAGMGVGCEILGGMCRISWKDYTFADKSYH